LRLLPPKAHNRLIALLAVLSVMISGCSPLYVIRAAYEEGKILWRREPIVAYLQNPRLEIETKEKLELVLAAREYADAVLKLNVGGSYASYSYVDRPVLSYILTAAPRTELKPYSWWFLFVGSVPYKGFFTKEDANAAAQALEERGYDTSIRPSAAFSTLGWFDDPLLAHLLKYDKGTLIEVIFHELFHNTLYVKGAGSFNESVANFVGNRAAIDFFRHRFGDGSEEYKAAVQAWEDDLEFSEFIERLADSLNELFAKDISDDDKLRLRQEVFARGKEEWAQRIADRPRHRFRNFSRQPLNNAVMIHYLLYLKNLKLFESVYESEGRNLVGAIQSIRMAVKRRGDPFESVQTLLAQRRAPDDGPPEPAGRSPDLMP
jgi:predicted aminopeptidase